MSPSRRQFLSLAALGLSTTAGCTGRTPSRTQTETTRETTRTTITETTTNEPPGDGRDALSWSYEIGHDIQYAPAVTDDALFVPSNYLYALSPDGSEQWVFETDARVEFSPRVRDAVYLARPEPRAIEFDGTERWTQSLDAPGIPYPLALTSETFYVGTLGHMGSPDGFTLVALDTTAGEERWRAEIGARSRAIVGESAIYVSSPGRVRAFDRDSGTERWSTRLSNTSLVTFAGLSEGRFVTGGDNLVALSEADGSEQWRFSDDRDYDDEAETITGVQLVGDTVFVATYDDVSALSVSDGSKRWSVGPYSEKTSVFAADDGTVYVGSSDVIALDADSGAEQWRWSSDEQVWSISMRQNVLYPQGQSWLAKLDTDGTERWQFDFGVQISDVATSGVGAFVGTRLLDDSRETTGQGTRPGTLYAFHE